MTEFEMPTPHPSLKRLDFLTGTWKMTGRTLDGPMGPGADMSGEETFEWMDGGFFLVHRWTGSFAVGGAQVLDTGYEFYDHNPATDQYRTHFYNNFGPYDPAGSLYEGTFEGESLVVIGPARIIRTLNADGTITCDSDVPDGEGGWIPFMRATLTPVPAA